MPFTGRYEILTSETEITRDNVVGVLNDALIVHSWNRAEIDYLWKYYKGDQPVLNRTKEVRPEICNRVLENRAYEIVNFWTGYLMGEPVQYVCRSGSEEKADEVTLLNDYAVAEEKQSKDSELAEWMFVAGIGYRMILPDPMADITDEEDSPFEIYTLDPRDTLVIRHNGLGKKPLMGVRFVKDSLGDTHFSCYTTTTYYEIVNGAITREEPHVLGEIPIVEYPANLPRLGAFEVVLALLDAINTTESNRVDGVEQFIQALMVFYNIDLTSEDFEEIKTRGGLKVKDIDPNMRARVEYLVNNMNQGETQVLVDHMYETVLTICAMPNRNGGSSTSDTGVAVIYRDGWSAAESKAKLTENMFKMSERKFLRLLLHICRGLGGLPTLKVSDISIQFTRRNYENIQSKAQVLIMMLQNSKIHPKLAFEHCGMFPDPDLAYKISMEYAEEQEKKMQEMMAQQGGADEGDSDTGDGGEDPGSSEARKPGGDPDRTGKSNDRRDTA